MTPAEIVKALREDCKTCSENPVCRNGLNLAGLYCANKDAADLIERLEKEKAALLARVKIFEGCDTCKNFNPMCCAEECGDCGKKCPCVSCTYGSEWEWKGLEDSNGTMHNQT